MKTFLNVLYRKILYKIPLKFLLLLLAIFGLLFASCNAGSYTLTGYFGPYTTSSTNVVASLPFYGLRDVAGYINIECFFSNFTGTYTISSTFNANIQLYSNNAKKNSLDSKTFMNFSYNEILNNGHISGTYYFNPNISNSRLYPFGFVIGPGGLRDLSNFYFEYSCTVSGVNMFDESSFNGGCTPQYTSEECQTEYGLVESGALISCETDLNSCISNTSGFNDLLNNCNNNLNACNLSLSSCLSNNCPTTSGDISWSSLFINDIQHIGGPSIYIGIPEEIERDYSYSDNDDMYINVDGYNVDYEKIEGIIDVQNYKPSQEDFNNIIGILADYMPIIVIFLGLLFIYKMIRKPFKSKL